MAKIFIPSANVDEFLSCIIFLQHGHVRHNALQGKLFLQVSTQRLMLELCLSIIARVRIKRILTFSIPC